MMKISRGKRGFIIMLIAFAAFGVGICVTDAQRVFGDAKMRAELSQSGVHTTGMVRFFLNRPHSQDMIFDFHAGDGRLIEKSFNTRDEIDFRETAFLMPGSTVAVIYDPSDPHRAMPAQIGYIPQRDMAYEWLKLAFMILIVTGVPLAGCWKILYKPTSSKAE